MSALSDLIDAVPQEVTFLGHNSGVAFRVKSAVPGDLLLKVHAPQGDGEPLSPGAILGGLQWLAEMAELTETPVQTPLPDPTGALLPTVDFRGVVLSCSLQQWIEGQQVEELSTAQAHEVGTFLGQWHAFSSQHASTSDDGVRYDSRHLEGALGDLRAVVDTDSVTEDTWRTIEQATALVSSLMDDLGTSADVFGVIHGDLGPDNVIVADDGAVRLIDLAQLAFAPYLWDLGTALYQYSYQEPSIRRDMVAGYRSARSGLTIPTLGLEAFVCAAALSNLAFQSSIPTRPASTLFQTNVGKFATGYCRDLVNGVPFALE